MGSIFSGTPCKEHKVKGHGRDTVCGIHTSISMKIQTSF